MLNLFKVVFQDYLGYSLLALVLVILMKIFFFPENKVSAKNNSIAIGGNNDGSIQQSSSDKNQTNWEKVFMIICGLASIFGLYFIFYPMN